ASLRALGHYGGLLEQVGDFNGAFDLYEEYYQREKDLSVALMMMHAACVDGRSLNLDKKMLLQEAKIYKPSYAPLLFSMYIIQKSQSGLCQSADLGFAVGVLDSLLENEKYKVRQKDIYVIKSKYYVGASDFERAYQELEKAFD